ncbi:MAG: hypothetical protein KDJ31_18285 [Candidatus Competibacteraceae bacterium]|nr:hypothetical protein [Candidatus Competibacteraceae bacterium]HRY14498.1 hypothetical protein [Candidatus Competibacteraceae bacterium]
MPTTFILPKAADVSKTLVMLFGGNVPATPGKPVDSKAGSGSLIASYIDDNGKVVAAFVCDIPLAANAGCALSMMPAAAAKDAIKTKKLEQAMLDNLYEVANILSTLLMNDKTPHLKVASLYSDAGKIPAEVREMLNAAKGHVDFTVNIPRYGNGRMSLLVL